MTLNIHPKFKHLLEPTRLRVSWHLSSVIFGSLLWLLCLTPRDVLGQGGVIVDELGTDDGLSYRWVFDLKKDQNGFLWIATYDGLNRYDGNKFTIFRHDSKDSNSLAGNRVRSLLPDRNGRIWLSIEGTPASFYHPITARFTSFTSHESSENSILNQEADRFFEDHDDNIWIGFKTFNKKVYALQKYLGNNKFTRPIMLRSEIKQVRSISEDELGNLWIWTTTQGYAKIMPHSDSVEYFPFGNSTPNTHEYLPIIDNSSFWYPSENPEDGVFSQIALPPLSPDDDWNNYFVDDKQNIWLHTDQNRVFRSDASKSKFEFIVHLDFDLLPNGDDVPPQDLAFLVDQDNTIWIGHFFGITKVVKPLSLFETYLNGRKTKLGMPINGTSARAIIETSNGQVYLRDQPGNLYYLDQEKRAGVRIAPKLDLGFSSGSYGGIGMHYDQDGLIWIGLPDGLLSFNHKTGEQKRYGLPDSLPAGLISDICPGDDDIFWLARAEGNLIFDVVEKTFANSPVPNLGLNYCYCDDEQQVIWSGHDKGLVRFDSKNYSHQYYPLFEDSRPGGEILSIVRFQDHLWLAGYQGLIKFDPGSGEHVRYSSADGLPHDIIYSVLSSGKELWLGTHSGLTRFNPTTLETTTFYEEQGLSHNEFNRSSYLKTRDGKLFFGGLNGVNAFYPAQLSNISAPKHVLQLMQVTRYSESQDTHLSSVWHQLQGVAGLVINPDEKDVIFDLAIMSLADPRNNQYSYLLEGLDADWRTIGSPGTISYNKLPAGSYRFKARAKDPHGNLAKNEINIPVYVRQIWYSKWWAWCLYTLAFASIAVGLYRFKIGRRLASEERIRLLELDGLKTKLYTNITHEFRTPLTVILGMNEALRKSIDAKTNPSGYQAINLIKRNGENLLNLINQMLDLSKLNSGRLALTLQQSDLIQYLKDLSEGYKIWAKQKNINFHFISMEELLMMDLDPIKLQQVISNLIANAIKFTPEGGNIYFKVDHKMPFEVTINIRDTGVGIPPEKLSYIFDRFYQVDTDGSRTEDGSGIGLALTKELVTLMEGQILVKSSISNGTDFTITLPIRQENHVVEAIQSPTPVPASPRLHEDSETTTLLSDSDSSKNIILIVDDNPDVIHIIKTVLQKQYKLLIARDGEEGTEIAINALPDIIITDVIMPKRNGFEMCAILKNDERTSHIPILVLTSKADQQAKMKGLEIGVDAYLTKPFQGTELQLRLQNFLRLRAKMQEQYKKDVSIVTEEPSLSDPFLMRIQYYVNTHLSDEHFGILQLCRVMKLSRAQLHRKITAMTGTSTSHFIRRIRLMKAQELLNDENLSIADTGRLVGFKSPSQFSRAFAEEFGHPPRNAKEGI